ncbi:hypothetical protein [Stratiformator vulcanicus]|uniref:Uncharacterized protein n=1 Tax=Stratiformator vulcanicus TaxID=2527980 RepID=A0A517QYJ4_9PLAN|nr:hypothetical protein [Stratiformator vulcanicus]QDT36664.1 hypothetical protein Pan189_10250 [Stratiformator vulcanicus]
MRSAGIAVATLCTAFAMTASSNTASAQRFDYDDDDGFRRNFDYDDDDGFRRNFDYDDDDGIRGFRGRSFYQPYAPRVVPRQYYYGQPRYYAPSPYYGGYHGYRGGYYGRYGGYGGSRLNINVPYFSLRIR